MVSSARALAYAAVFTGLVSACAIPEPEPCTSEWVDWKKDQVFSEFTAAHRSDLRVLRNLEDDLNDPGVIGAVRLASRASMIGDMVETFVDVTVPDLQTSLAPCLSSPLSASELMADLLLDQGVDETVVTWVQALGAFMETGASSPGEEDA
ncbi:MAG: hypothetical protein AAGJ32_03595 [Pseudomonadota bacterium]